MTRPVALDRATRLEGDAGRYSVMLDDAWEIWGPSGGFNYKNPNREALGGAAGVRLHF